MWHFDCWYHSCPEAGWATLALREAKTFYLPPEHSHYSLPSTHHSHNQPILHYSISSSCLCFHGTIALCHLWCWHLLQRSFGSVGVCWWIGLLLWSSLGCQIASTPSKMCHTAEGRYGRKEVQAAGNIRYGSMAADLQPTHRHSYYP